MNNIFNSEEVLEELTPTPTPVAVVVENMPDYLEELLTTQNETIAGISQNVEQISAVSQHVTIVAYFAFVLVLFELLRFVKGLKNKEVK